MKLIDKDALVAEIKRRYETNLIGAHSAFKNGKIEALREVKDKLDTLEVKDVDLEKEAERFVQTKEFAECKGSPVMVLAKHFFELGMSASNKEQKGEGV